MRCVATPGSEGPSHRCVRASARGPGLWTIVLALALAAAVGTAVPVAAERPVRNGFPLGEASVPAEETLAGGPPRDGIPALDDPEAVPVGESSWNEEAIVLEVGGAREARAYPFGILNWHEVANDTLGGKPIVVTCGPLRATGMVFDRRVDGETLCFGVSGLLYRRSDVLLFDRRGESLGSQSLARAISGPHPGTWLTLLRSRMRPLAAFRETHSGGLVLSRDTGHDRPYYWFAWAAFHPETEVFRSPAAGEHGPDQP